MNGREFALKVLFQVNEEGAYANIALDKAFADYTLHDSRDRGLATELVYGCVKYRGHLDWIINQFAKIKVKKMAPWIRNIIRLGLYQIIYLDKVPVSAAVNESVKLAKKYGHQGTVKFVNGILRNIERNKTNINYPSPKKAPLEYISIRYSFPNWMIKGWLKDYGFEDTIKMCQYFNEPAPLWIRTNTLKISRDELMAHLAAKDIQCVESLKSPDGIRIENNLEVAKITGFKEGFFTVQDESSMLVSQILDPQPGQTILDVCSGPGGKTSHLAQLMNNKGLIRAFDVHPHRLKLIEETCERLGITNVVTEVADARKLTTKVSAPVDGVLVDAPCSGLGVLGRRPDARWRKRQEDILDLQRIQKDILKETARLVKSGGTLVYSTCTITQEENQDVIESFLAQNSDFYLDNKIERFLPSQASGNSKGWIQFLPFKDQMDGFFIARLKRK